MQSFAPGLANQINMTHSTQICLDQWTEDANLYSRETFASHTLGKATYEPL